jgi:hypothetical protein
MAGSCRAFPKIPEYFQNTRDFHRANQHATTAMHHRDRTANLRPDLKKNEAHAFSNLAVYSNEIKEKRKKEIEKNERLG